MVIQTWFKSWIWRPIFQIRGQISSRIVKYMIVSEYNSPIMYTDVQDIFWLVSFSVSSLQSITAVTDSCDMLIG
jgi:hypothetical protein